MMKIKFLNLIKPPKKRKSIPRLDLEADNVVGFDREGQKIINLLNYTKVSGSSYSGVLYDIGYQTIVIDGKTLSGQRNPMERLKNVPLDFKNKSVLDLGCNQGGMLHALAKDIKVGVGLDYDYKMVNVANKIKSYHSNSNLDFFVFNLEKENLEYIKDFIVEEIVDICFLLSVCMWLKNWKELIVVCKGISKKMLFESNGSAEQQNEQINFLNSIYKSVQVINETSEDDPIQKNRKLLLCYD